MFTFPRIVLADRLTRARALAAEHGYAALLLASASRAHTAGQSGGNTAYFLGYTPVAGAVLLLIPLTGRPIVLAAGPNEARMLAARVGDLAEVRRAGTDPGATLAALLAERGLRADGRMGLAGRPDLPGRLLDRLDASLPRLIDCDADIHAMRAQVDPADLTCHAEAARISDLMLAEAFILARRPGMTPARLMADLEQRGRAAGAEIARLWLATGSNPPVTSFEFFELPATLAPGDRVQLGTTVVVEGHFCQGLRMGTLGQPSAALRAASQTLLAIQDQALAVMAPDRPAHLIVDTLETLIAAHCPYGRADDPFRFQSCHQLGLDYADPALGAALNPDRDRGRDAEGPRLCVGQVIEIHPNYSLPGLGHVCQGDAAVVTATGAEWLTRAPRGLTVMDR